MTVGNGAANPLESQFTIFSGGGYLVFSFHLILKAQRQNKDNTTCLYVIHYWTEKRR